MKSTDGLEIPTVHLNGTSKADLMEQNLEALSKIREAIEALQQATPNGRDYYLRPVGGGSYDRLQAAIEQHRWRVKLLTQVQREIEFIVEKIDAQGGR